MQIFLELIPVLVLLFLVFVLLNPLFWIFMLILAPVLFLIALYFLSLEFFILALINLVVVPKQLWHMFKNPVLRKNHALEHATINVLEERYGELKDIGGLADVNGFHIYSGGFSLSPDEVLSAAQEGLLRLRSGERKLAIHKRCGTSVTIANLLLSAVFILLLIFGGYFNLLNTLIAVALAYLLSRPLGKLAQEYITTDPDVSDMEIVGLDIPAFVRYFGLPLPNFGQRFFVETRRIPKARRIY